MNGKYDYKYAFKYIMIGDTGVGKSCLVLRLTDDRFKLHHELTIGVEFGSKILKLDDTQIKLQIWDTAGQEAFQSITRSYYRGIAGAVVVYDITRRKTFNNVTKWINDLKEECPDNCSIVLIGNKTDVKNSERKVSEKEGKLLAEKYNCNFIETSVKNNVNVEKAFQLITKDILTKVNSKDIIIDETNGITLPTLIIKKKPKKKLCKSCIIL